MPTLEIVNGARMEYDPVTTTKTQTSLVGCPPLRNLFSLSCTLRTKKISFRVMTWWVLSHLLLIKFNKTGHSSVSMSPVLNVSHGVGPVQEMGSLGYPSSCHLLHAAWAGDIHITLELHHSHKHSPPLASLFWVGSVSRNAEKGWLLLWCKLKNSSCAHSLSKAREKPSFWQHSIQSLCIILTSFMQSYMSLCFVLLFFFLKWETLGRNSPSYH